MFEVEAEPYWRLSSLIGQMIVRLEAPGLDGKTIGGTLGETQRRAKDLRLTSAVKKLDRIKEHFLSGTATNQTMRQMCIDLHERILDELEGRFFLVLDELDVPLFRQPEPLFGCEDAFPGMGAEVEEAGKCVALGRYTAAVFHLMRAMEVAVKALAETLGVDDTERVWGQLLSDIDRKISALPKGANRDAWSEARANLYHVKQAWRNDTMHPKETYTEDQAREILAAMRTFARQLATLM